MTTPHTLTEDAAASLAAILGTDGPLVRAFDAGGPMTGADPDGPTWHLATCHRCGHDLAEPFAEQADRDLWAVTHVSATGHSVVLSDDPAGAGPAMILRRVDRMWIWICSGCTELSGQRGRLGSQTIEEFRLHVCGDSR